jgi:hypothetical protein
MMTSMAKKAARTPPMMAPTRCLRCKCTETLDVGSEASGILLVAATSGCVVRDAVTT